MRDHSIQGIIKQAKLTMKLLGGTDGTKDGGHYTDSASYEPIFPCAQYVGST